MLKEAGKLIVQCYSRDQLKVGWRRSLPPSLALSTTERNVSQGQVPPCHHTIPPSLWQSARRPAVLRGERAAPAGPGRRTAHERARLYKAPLRNAHFVVVPSFVRSEGKKRSSEEGAAVPLFKHLPS